MRFLMGLLSGAALVLLLAQSWRTVLPAPWAEEVTQWRENAAILLRTAARGAIEAAPEQRAAGRPVVPAPAVPAPAVAETAEHPAAEHPVATKPIAENTVAAKPVAAKPVAAKPVAAKPVAEKPAAEHPAPDDPPSGATDAARLLADATAEPLARPPDPLAPRAAGGPPARPQAVWVPFRSEMSASGFAARLSAALEHPFEVERQGPGRYQVMFEYHSEAQRAELLARLAEATGASR